MQDFSIGRSTRRCRHSGRPLSPGEKFYSVIEAKGDKVVRFEIAAAHWTEPPTDAIAWWAGEIPPAAPAVRRPATKAELRAHLASLSEDPASAPLAYLLAMLLVRRRVLEIVNDDENSGMIVFQALDDHARFAIPQDERLEDPETAMACQSALQELLIVAQDAPESVSPHPETDAESEAMEAA